MDKPDEQENKDREDFKEWYLNHDSKDDDPNYAWWDIVFDYFNRYHVEPLQKLVSRYSNQEVTISNLQSEITRLKEENESLKDRIKCLINEGEQPPF